ncbi:hypothetical protein D9613_008743 [Agrocybe pediades]|uniref:Purine-cytosine permease n=1 Tax=Agrocybe pediades TaxID=84607 RepID=A0A8H4QTG4_9AGAR|nr:hypothetical protein D9613_008743 [Agrocybe pediades]
MTSDIEKSESAPSMDRADDRVNDGDEKGIGQEKQLGIFRNLTERLMKYGVETHGITPIPVEQRTETRTHQFFWLWFSVNFNILAFSSGSAGPAFFGLGLNSSLLTMLVVDLLTCIVPAYFAIFGPKLGTRGMVQCRFSWGLWGGVIPSILNVFSMQGFLILNCIIGGQTLAATSNKLDDTLGIVIIGVISLVVCFCGYRILHWFENYAWVPSVIAFPILLGLAGKHLNPSTMPSVPAPSPAMILSFASFLSSSVISWCTVTPDYGVYHDSKASSVKMFVYVYLGFVLPFLAWHMLGAALAAAALGIPSWQSGFDGGNNMGGLLDAVLSPAGGFGKFVLVLIALSTSCACAPTMYTFGTSFMSIHPFFARVPRYIFAIVSEALLIPLAIVGARTFYNTLVDILSVIGYWSTAFGAIVLVEHIYFRQCRFSSYDISQWDNVSLLPPGIAAVLAFCGAFGIIVPSMQQTWYTGPIAKAGTGDIGIFTGAVVAAVLYFVLRFIEKRIWPGR